MSTNHGQGGKPRNSRPLIRSIPDEDAGTSAPSLFKRASFKDRPQSIAARIDNAAQKPSRTMQGRNDRPKTQNAPHRAAPARGQEPRSAPRRAEPPASNLRPSPTPSAWGMEGRENVGIGEMAFLQGQGLLTTHGLGSCVGVAVYDPDAQLGGLIHIMLPDSTINAEKARNNPLLFADTGLHLLLREFRRHGGALERSILRLAGGASTQGENDLFHIGKRNSATLRKLLWRERIAIHAEDIGGNDSRTMMLNVQDGTLLIRIPGQDPRSL